MSYTKQTPAKPAAPPPIQLTMPPWKKVWRDGVVPLLSTEGLLALQRALLEDDPRLMQGATTEPPPLMSVQDWDCERACLLGFPCWQGDGLTTVGEIEEAFARLCFEADQRVGEPAAIRFLLNWYDETPREEVRAKLLYEVGLALRSRRQEKYTDG